MLVRMIRLKKKTPRCQGEGIIVRKAPEKGRGGQVHRTRADGDLGHSVYPLCQERARGKRNVNTDTGKAEDAALGACGRPLLTSSVISGK